jgi:NTP pyrophosphatase (non-canonical NTP hydrolase)
MNFREYQNASRKTAIYPMEYKVVYPMIGLSGETGEVAEKIKKQIRDKNSDFKDIKFKKKIAKEIGDVLWYLSQVAYDLEISLQDAAEDNLKKLQRRMKRKKINGEGDNR